MNHSKVTSQVTVKEHVHLTSHATAQEHVTFGFASKKLALVENIETGV